MADQQSKLSSSLQKILHTMQDRPNDTEIHKTILATLTTLATSSGLQTNKVFITNADAMTLLDVMRVNSNSAPVQQVSCLIIGYLSATGTQNANVMIEANSVEAIVTAMHLHSDSVRVQCYACLALKKLSVDQHARIAIASGGGISATVDSITNHPNNPKLREQACCALQSFGNQKNQTSIVYDVLKAMKVTNNNLRVHECLVRVLNPVALRALQVHQDATIGSRVVDSTRGHTIPTRRRIPAEIPASITCLPENVARPLCEPRDASVAIVGGGPVGLLTALLLLDQLQSLAVTCNITIYESRWIRRKGRVSWCGEAENNNRRWQVVTIQSRVWSLLPTHVQHSLFPNPNDGSYQEMWPFGPDSPREVGSPRNIPIRIIEDRLLDLLQDRHNVSLVCKRATKQDVQTDFVIVANGGWGEPIIDFGRTVPFPEDPQQKLQETVLGIYVQHPDGESPAIGVNESVGMALTVGQNQYLWNGLGQRMGFLNMWLTVAEAESAVGVDMDGLTRCSQGKPCVLGKARDGNYRCKNHSNSLFLPAQQKATDPLWKSIQDA